MLRDDVFTRNLMALDICFNLPCIFYFKSCSQKYNTTFILYYSPLPSTSLASPKSDVCQSGRSGAIFGQWNCTTCWQGARESKLKLAMAAPYFPDEIFNEYIVWKWRGVTNMNMYNEIFSQRTFFGRGKMLYRGKEENPKNHPVRLVPKRFHLGTGSKKKTAGSCNYDLHAWKGTFSPSKMQYLALIPLLLISSAIDARSNKLHTLETNIHNVTNAHNKSASLR